LLLEETGINFDVIKLGPSKKYIYTSYSSGGNPHYSLIIYEIKADPYSIEKLSHIEGNTAEDGDDIWISNKEDRVYIA